MTGEPEKPRYNVALTGDQLRYLSQLVQPSELEPDYVWDLREGLEEMLCVVDEAEG